MYGSYKMKKLISLSAFLFACSLCLLPTYASNIDDYDNLLTQTAQLELEDQIDELEELTGVNISMIFPEEYGDFSDGSEYTYAEFETLHGDDSDAILLMLCVDKGEWLLVSNGIGSEIADEYFQDFIKDNVMNYISVGKYEDAFVKYVDYLGDFINAYLDGNAYSQDNEYDLNTDTFALFSEGQDIIDLSELISSDVEASMQEIIDQVRSDYNFNISIITVEDFGDFLSTRTYTDAAYEHMYGQEDGVILMLCLNSRDWYISTEAYGDTAINDYCLDVMEEKVITSFSSANYDKGFYDFVSYSADFVEEAKTNTPYTYNNEYLTTGDFLKTTLIVIVASSFIGLAYILMLSKQMKNIRAVDTAGNYILKDTFHLESSSDKFLYSHVSKTVKPKNTSSGGGRGSGGGSSGGRGGKF